MDCPICLDTVKIPTELGCSHVFCLKCIINWIGSWSSLANLKCPLCRSYVDMLEFGAREFYNKDIHFLVHAYQFIQRSPNNSKREILTLLQNEFDELDMFNENFDKILVTYVCVTGFIGVEYEFLKSLM